MTTIINADHIRLNGGQGAPGDLADAELYLDEAAGLVYVKTESGIYGVPLAVLTPPDEPGDPGLALVKTDLGAAYAALTAGAGGRPFDGRDWRIPGCAPIGVGRATFSAGSTYYSLFEMSEAKTVLKQRVVLTTAVSVTFGICAWSDGTASDILSTATVSAAGANINDISLDLAPGVYAMFFTPAATVEAQVIDCGAGMPRITPNFLGYPVALSF